MKIKVQQTSAVPMPMLFLANAIHPIVGVFMSFILLGMIYNTAVEMLYAFSARIITPETKKFKGSVVVFGDLAYAASFIGFITLVGTVYPMMGYLGFTRIAAIVFTWFTNKRKVQHV